MQPKSATSDPTLPICQNYLKDLKDLSRLQPHLLSSPNYSTLQSAYRSLHSTETALLKVTDDIYRSMDNGSFTALVSLDISAAYDTTDRRQLLSIDQI